MARAEEIFDSDGENAENDLDTHPSIAQESAAAGAASKRPSPRGPRDDGMQEKVAQFMSVTDTDADQAKHWLEITGGNLEQAVSFYFDDNNRSGGSRSNRQHSQPKSNQEELSKLLADFGLQGPEVERELSNLQGVEDLTLGLKKSQFLQKVQPEARAAAASLPRYDPQLGGEVDVLAGATFLWSQPPRVVHVQPGTAAHGVVDVGETLRSLDGLEVSHLPRREILQMLANAHQMGMRKSAPKESRFDKVSGLEISKLGSVEVKWTDMPVVLSDSQKDSAGSQASPGDVVRAIGGVCLMGKTKEEVYELHDQADGMSLVGGALLQSMSGGMELVTVAKLKQDGVPIHPQVQCSNCATRPLVGTRYHCTVCESFDYCGTCHAGRAHSHPSNHRFEIFRFHGLSPVDAPAPLQLAPRAKVVVCGSGGASDGTVGEVKARQPNGRWHVQLGGGVVEAVLPQHLFLRSGGARGVQLAPLPPSQTVVPTAQPTPAMPSQAPRPRARRREQSIAHMLGFCSEDGYDAQSGLPISLLGRLIIRWCQLPVILSDLDTPEDRMITVIALIGGEQVWGKSRSEVEDMNNRSGRVGAGNITSMLEMWRQGNAGKTILRLKLRQDRLPIHIESQCDGCSTSPLCGWRYLCQQCPSYNLCGTCYPARVHSHPPHHSFVKLEFLQDPPQPAEPGLAIGFGAEAVVCGTGNAAWDGSEVVLGAFKSNNWEVTLSRDPSAVTLVAARHLFLLSSGRADSPSRGSSAGSPVGRGEFSPSRGSSAGSPVGRDFSLVPLDSVDTHGLISSTASQEVVRCHETGLEVSTLKRLKVLWCQLPVVLYDPEDKHIGKVMCAVRVDDTQDKPLWGCSREEAEKVYYDAKAKRKKEPGLAVRALPKTMEAYAAKKDELLQLQVRVHPEVRCEGCRQEPLIGQRYRCRDCPSNFCGACYTGRAHGHPSEHRFVVRDFPDADCPIEGDAPPGLVLGRGARAVVCGTPTLVDGEKIAGHEVKVKTQEADGSWQVQQGSRRFSVQPQHLFLLSGACEEEEEEEEENDNPCVKVAQLESITGWEEAQVVSLLEKHGWSVDKAKRDFEQLQKAEAERGGGAAEAEGGGGAVAQKRWEDHVLLFHIISRDQVDLPESPPKELELGEGSFGQVYKAKLRGESVAAKVVNLKKIASSEKRRKEMLKSVKREAAKLLTFQHPSILGFRALVLEKDSDEVIIITEFCERGSLRDVLEENEGPLEYRLACSTMCQVAKAMDYLHQPNRKLAHRDLKSLNILVKEDYSVKVGDFGLTEFTQQMLTESASRTANRGKNKGVGSARWMAPEIEIAEEFTGCWLKCDVYSFACVIFEVLTGKLPWGKLTAMDIVRCLANSKRPDYQGEIPDSALARLMRRCWVKEPQERPAFSEILEELVKLEKPGTETLS